MDEPRIVPVNGYEVIQSDKDDAYYVWTEDGPIDGPFATEAEAVEAARVAPSRIPLTK